jgi:N-acetylglutamate synthase-like GNAT family acetyltransferase
MLIRRANIADIPRLEALIDASVRGLQTRDYSPEQIDGALRGVYGVDTRLIDDATYYAAEVEDGAVLAGCGGWSRRKTLFGGDHYASRQDALLDPSTDAAKIRAFFVHPQWARRGIGSLILDACENAARIAGFTRFELAATLTGVPFYRARGYLEIERLEAPAGNGISLTVIHMEKQRRCPLT